MGGAADEICVRPQVLAHHGPVDHPAGREPAGRGRDRAAELDRALRHRLSLDLVAAGPLEGSRDARAHPEGVVRRVRHGVRLDGSDVRLADFQPQH